MPAQRFKKYFKRKGPCRSQAEAAVYEDLEARGVPFEYEKSQVIYTTPPVQHKYVPDFKIGNIYVEYKGWFKPEDRAKMLLVIQQHPDLDIRLLFMKDSKLYKDSDTRYSDWCEKYGIKYAIGTTVPQEWIDEAYPKVVKRARKSTPKKVIKEILSRKEDKTNGRRNRH